MSEVFEINTEKLKVKINGVPYEFNEPSADQTKALQDKFKEFDENSGMDAVGLYKDFFKELGLAPEALSGLSSKKIIDLFEYAVGAKKN